MSIKSLPFKEALEIVFRESKAFWENIGEEMCSYNKITGRILAEDIISCYDVPEQPIATMDGYALKWQEGKECYRDSGIYIGAGARLSQSEESDLVNAEAVEIATGARVPEGFDTVVKIEDIKRKKGEIIIPVTSKGKYVLQKGENLKKGELLLKKGEWINYRNLPLLKFSGRRNFKVKSYPRVGVFTSGDEILKGEIVETNTVLMKGFLESLGWKVDFLGILEDDFQVIEDFIMENIEEYDLLISSGSVSLGKRDFLAQVIYKHFQVIFHGIKIHPGKPLLLAKSKNRNMYFWGLPGKPGGTFTSLHLFLHSFIKGKFPYCYTEWTLPVDIKVGKPGDMYVIYGRKEGEELKFILSPESEYQVSLFSNSPLIYKQDFFILTDRNLSAGERVRLYFL